MKKNYFFSFIFFLNLLFTFGQSTDNYNYVIGTQAFGKIENTYKFTSEGLFLEQSRRALEMGSNLIKTEARGNYLVNNEWQDIADLSFSHIFLWWDSQISAWSNDEVFDEAEYQAQKTKTYNFCKYLLQRYNNSGKTFYLGNWEGDWYLLDGFDRTVIPSQARSDAMARWLNSRQEGVDMALSEGGFSNINIYHYAEVNAVKDARVNGLKRMVNTVLPQINVDFISYSAYDIQNEDQATLNATLDYLESYIAPKPTIDALFPKRVFIGEFARNAQAVSYNQTAHELENREIISKFMKWGCPFILYWQMYNNVIRDDQQVGFWLIDDNNVKWPLFYTFQNFYSEMETWKNAFNNFYGRNPNKDEFLSESIKWLDGNPSTNAFDLISDWDTPTLPWSANKVTYSTVTNPDNSGINTTAQSAKIITNGGNWNLIKTTMNLPIDFSVTPTIDVMVLPPAEGGVLKFKINNAENPSFVERDITFLANSNPEWEKITLDFSNETKTDLTEVVLFFDLFQNEPGNKIWHIDEIFNLKNNPPNNNGIISDWDSTTLPWNGSKVAHSTVANPDNSGINTTAQTAKVTSTGGNWNLIETIMNSPIDFSVTPTIDVMVFPPTDGGVLKFKIQNPITLSFVERDITFLANPNPEWEKITLDFSNETKTDLTKVVLFFDLFQNVTGNKIWYIDELFAMEETPPNNNGIISDWDSTTLPWNGSNVANSTVANPNNSGINTTAQTAKITTSGGNWNLIEATMNSPIDFSVTPTVDVMVLPPAEGGVLRFKIQNPVNPSFVERDITFLANSNPEWEKITLDFSNETKTDLTKVVLFFDLFQNATGNKIWYVDEIIKQLNTSNQSKSVSKNNLVKTNDQNDLLINVYPNPVDDYFIITNINKQKKNVRIINSIGRVVDQFVMKDSNYRYNTNRLNAGLYFIQVIDNSTVKFKKTIIKL